MRGKLIGFAAITALSGITPAHAGKTIITLVLYRPTADHPRTCGENQSTNAHTPTLSGSPPHMRGKPSKFICVLSALRITPAHAGKTVFRNTLRTSRTDHPRTCGENIRSLCSGILNAGSPPHMRGKQRFSCILRVKKRITPAHAGKTLRKCYIAEVNPHPIRQFPLTSHKVVVSSGNPAKLCVILLYQIESILLKSGVYSPVHPPAFVLQGLTCQL